MKTKLFSLFLALVASVGTIHADWQHVKIGDLYYDLYGFTWVARVTYDSWGDNYNDLYTAEIPTSVSYGGTSYKVVSIEANAFVGSESLTSVTIPESVTTISDGAFARCVSLTSVSIPNSVKSIGRSVFSGCSNLTGVELPNKLTNIAACAFSNCNSLSSITIPESVTSIDSAAFYNCSSLSSITIPEQVTNIGDKAFESCESLSSFVLPNSVTKVGRNAFKNCNSLTSPVYNVHVFAYMPTSYSGAYTIPSNIESISGGAFESCENLTMITIPHHIQTIGAYAFLNCNNLLLVHLNSNKIASENNMGVVFGKQVQKYVIGDSVTTIGESAFSNSWGNTSDLKSIVIGKNVVTIGNMAFYECDSLKSIAIPDKVEYIGRRAFEDCKNLKSISIGAGLKNVYNDAFYNCDKLDSVNISNLADWCKINFENSVANPLCDPWNIREAILYQNGDEISGTLIIPNSVTRLGKGIFQKYAKITSIKIPSSVTYIGESAFAGCAEITSLVIPNSVDTIERYAFSSCDSLKSVIIGQSCKYVGADAFSSCKKVHSCVIGKNVESMLRGFDKCYDLTKINCLITYPREQVYIYLDGGDASNHVYLRVPRSSVNSYQNADPYRSYYRQGELYISGIDVAKNIETTEVSATLVNPDDNITSSHSDVKLSWPEVENAAWYVHEIKKEGVIVGSFISNDEGQIPWGDFYGCGADSTSQYLSTSNLTGHGWTSNYSLENGKTYTYTVTAMYDPQVVLYVKSAEFTIPPTKFEVSFYNWDGELLQRTYVVEGEMPIYTGDTPTRPNDEEYTYTFKGWNPEIVAASWETENYYYAIYEAKPIGEGIEDIYSDSLTPTKILNDGQIYIIRGDKTYTLQGQEVK